MKRVIPVAMLIMAACVAPAESQNDAAGNEAAAVPSVPRLEGSCDETKAQSLVGRARSDALGQEAMRLTGAARLRWIGPGQAVTMDFSPSRLNIEYDEGGRVTTIRCG